jgi:hypothetical protein
MSAPLKPNEVEIPECTFTSTELIKVTANRGESKILARLFKEICIERQDFDAASQWRDMEKVINKIENELTKT